MFKKVSKKQGIIAALLLLITLCFIVYVNKQTQNIYSDRDNWAYLETEENAKVADVFFICPTVYGGDDSTFNMSLDDAETKENFLGAINMEKGIYDAECRFFAPYYRQAALYVYTMDIADREQYLDFAYKDIKRAFEYYLKNYNEGRPIVLAGFSQGADLSIRLLKDCFADADTNKLLVACYAIGWSITEEELQEYSHLKVAEGESDIGVIISFNSEAEDVTDSLMIPEGTKTYAMNPLNWKSDETFADCSLNMGACFTDYSGDIVTEIPQLTGAYIDSTRGALKVVDVTVEEYPPVLPIFEEGVYHLYDYQFFYRNLQDNVATRVAEYVKGNE